MFGEFLAVTALALTLQRAGAGGLAVAGLLLAGAAPLALLAPLAGRIADRADSRAVLISAGAAQAVLATVLAFVTAPAVIIGLVALIACGLAVTQPTLAALVPAMVRRDDITAASGLSQTVVSVGLLLGPAAGGVLTGQFGTRVPVLVAAVGYLSLVGAGLLLRTRRGGGVPRTEKETATAPWRLRDDGLVRTMVFALAAVVAGVGAINVIDIFFIRETLHASATMYGLIGATWTAGALLGSVVFGRIGRRWTEPAQLVRLTLLLMGGCCAAVLAAAAVPNALALVPIWLAGGLCNGGLNLFAGVVVARQVPEGARGRAYAVLSSATQSAGMIGFLVAGPLLEMVAPRVLVAAAGIAGLVAVLACLAPVRRPGREIAPCPQVAPVRLHPVGDSVEI
ncbi:Transmembrane secretion effector [Actinoplanes sp. N902-109]|nr:Transmembrane secretion effector [Actinoplanes sp. N902-109]